MATNLTDLSGSIRLNANITATKVDDFSASVPNDPMSFTDAQTIAFGATGSLVDEIYRVNDDVDTTITYDFTSGGIYNVFGQQINLSIITHLIIRNNSTDLYLIVSDSAGSNQWDLMIRPGGTLYLATDIEPSNLTLTAEAGSGSVNYDLIVVGIQA